MTLTAEEVVVKLRANMADYERRLEGAVRVTDQVFTRIGKASDQAEAKIRRNSAEMGSALKGVAATLAATFTGRELIAVTDAYTRFQNALKVAGLEGVDLARVQEQLFSSAQRYGVELETLGQLFGRASQAAASLGASQADLLRFTDNVSAAVKVQGGNVQEASGALLQLSQALQAGTVRAEEFNSINEGLFPVLQAVAAGSERFGGSVATLRAAVIDGTVSSQEFFRAFQDGASILEERAAKATLTTSAALTTLSNAVTKYFGEADKANGATAALAEAIELLADNLDVVIPAIAVLSTGLGVGFVTNAGRAALAAKGVGGALLGAFGGPVGVAITGVTVALVGLASESANTRAAMERVDDIAGDAARALQEAAGRADSAADGVRGVGSEAATSETKVRSFAGAVGDAAQKLYELARARQAAFISDLEAKRQSASLEYSGLVQNTDANIRRNLNTSGQGIGTFFGAVGARAQRLLGIGPSEAEVQEKLGTLRDAMSDYDEAIRAASKNLERFTSSGAQSTGGGAATKAKATVGGAAQAARDVNAFAREEASLSAELLAVRAASARTAEERAAVEIERIEFEKSAYLREIANDRGLTAAEKVKAGEMRKLIASLQTARVIQERDNEVRDHALQANALNARYAIDALQEEASAAPNRRSRLAAESRILDAIEAQEKADFDAAVAAGAIADADKARADLARKQAIRRQEARDANASPLASYAKGLADTDVEDRIESYVVDELQSVQDGISSALLKQIGTKDPIIAGLLNLFIEQVIMRPIAEALAKNSSAGGGIGGGLIAGISAVFGGFFANGGTPPLGKVSIVGERGPELFVPRQVGNIVPNHAILPSASASISVPQYLSFDLRGAVMTADLLAQMNAMATQARDQAYHGAIRDTPNIMAKRQRYGS